MATLPEIGLRFGGNVEVELIFSLNVSVPNKGAGYKIDIVVSPNDKMEILRSKVHFYSLFSGRGCQLYDPKEDRFYETEEINTLLFRDSGLKDGSELQLKANPNVKASPVSAEQSVEANAEEPMADVEGGNDASEVNSIDTDEAMRIAQEKYDGQAAEEGEGEGEEGEADMQEDDEEAAEGEGEIYQAGSEAE